MVLLYSKIRVESKIQIWQNIVLLFAKFKFLFGGQAIEALVAVVVEPIHQVVNDEEYGQEHNKRRFEEGVGREVHEANHFSRIIIYVHLKY